METAWRAATVRGSIVLAVVAFGRRCWALPSTNRKSLKVEVLRAVTVLQEEGRVATARNIRDELVKQNVWAFTWRVFLTVEGLRDQGLLTTINSSGASRKDDFTAYALASVRQKR